MRLSSKKNNPFKEIYKIIAVGDESGINASLATLLERSTYTLVRCTNPLEAIELVKNEHFDLMLLNFMMEPIRGDKVIEEIRKFEPELHIILLTENKDLMPSLKETEHLFIQGYCKKNNELEQMFFFIESAIKSTKQMQIIQQMNTKLKKSKRNLEKAYLESIEILRQTVEAKDTYTRGHSDRVSEYSVLIGKHMGLSKTDLNTLKIGGLFHDIGKIGIPDSILLKEGKLTDDEYSQIKNHPSIGKHILSNATIFKDILPIVLYHHEKFDGNGYPNGLSGEDIPLFARILAIADTFDAMTSKRSYRNALPLEDVISEIEKCSGTQFDPQIADIFLNILKNHYEEIQKIQEKY